MKSLNARLTKLEKDAAAMKAKAINKSKDHVGEIAKAFRDAPKESLGCMLNAAIEVLRGRKCKCVLSVEIRNVAE